MNILVFGAGAVGGYLGASLSHTGHQVTLVTRPAAADTINANGLTVTSQDGEHFIARPKAVISLRQAMLERADYDLVLLTMKSYDVETAINELVAFYPAPQALMTLQNGIGLEEKFLKQFPGSAIIAASLTTPLRRDSSHAVWVERNDRGLALAPTRPRQAITPWVKLMQRAGIETTAIRDYRSLKWSKAFLNIVGNAASAILNRHPRLIYAHRLTYALEMRMLKETLAVMRKSKIKLVDLPGAPAARLSQAVRWIPDFIAKPFLTRAVAAGRGEKMPSFHIDLAAGKENNEVLYHNGAIAEAGQKLGLAVPVNAALNDILLKLARKELNWRDYDGQPKRLLAEIKRYR